MMTKRSQGFTLIELMIVVAIISILAAIALPVYRTYTAKAKIINAVAGVAGEKIKIALNWQRAASDLCEGIAEDARLECDGGAIMLSQSTSAGGDDTQIRVTPEFPPAGSGDRINWTCIVLASPVERFVGDDCDAPVL